jgi:hypothetical protein
VQYCRPVRTAIQLEATIKVPFLSTAMEIVGHGRRWSGLRAARADVDLRRTQARKEDASMVLRCTQNTLVNTIAC